MVDSIRVYTRERYITASNGRAATRNNRCQAIGWVMIIYSRKSPRLRHTLTVIDDETNPIQPSGDAYLPAPVNHDVDGLQSQSQESHWRDSERPHACLLAVGTCRCGEGGAGVKRGGRMERASHRDGYDRPVADHRGH